LSNYLIQKVGATFPWEKMYKISSRLSQYLPYHITYWYDILLLCLYRVIFITQHNVGFAKMFFVEHRAAHAYVFILIVWYYVIFLRWKRLYASFFIVCLYMYCRWIPSYQEGSWDHINWLIPQPFCTGAKPGHWFPTSYVMVAHFCVSELKWEVIVHVADNSGMSCQNIFNFLFAIHQWCYMVRGKDFSQRFHINVRTNDA
jgi:hypothetical protein